MRKILFIISLAFLFFIVVKLCFCFTLVSCPKFLKTNNIHIYSLRGMYGSIKNDTTDTFCFPICVPNPIASHLIRKEVDIWMAQYPELDDSTNLHSYPLNRQNIKDYQIVSIISRKKHLKVLFRSKHEPQKIHIAFCYMNSRFPFRINKLEIKSVDGNWRMFY